MKITFKLYATLSDYLPVEARRTNMVELEVGEGATIAEIIAPYNLPPKLVHLVLVNGVFIAPEARATRALADGDALAIWPPVAGG
jgi:sulfur carrier protein ThiS